MPEISLPDIKLPDVKFRDGKLRDVKLPDIDLRDRLPDVDLSRISLPAGLREVSMPEVSMPDISLRDVRVPEIRRPDIHVDLSDLDLKAIDPRRIDLSGIDADRLREIVPFMKPARKPASRLPFVLLAAVGGIFAAWWLATSSRTGPRVRSLAADIRRRVDEMRGDRGWDDTEGRGEGSWPSEHDWKAQSDQATGGTVSEGTAGHSGGSWSRGSGAESAAMREGDTAGQMGDTEEAGDGGGYFAADTGVGGTGYEPVEPQFGSGPTVDREG
jgi:hypothetical protein